VGNLLRPRSGLPPLAGYALGWITARDPHLRRVSFQFGAASGGTSVLVVYPGYGVVLAVVANLGHAKPFRLLVNISKPFLPPSDPTSGCWPRSQEPPRRSGWPEGGPPGEPRFVGRWGR
jgi:hypothetical protein